MATDQIPSVKFRKPDKVTLLLLFSFTVIFLMRSTTSSLLSSSAFFLWPERSSKQSMSSITMIDLFEASINSLLSSVLS
ncbi:hypothetical protein BT93_I1016 [Corymbia citriodora subsp. variegata]|nr:hypothetical protein BT93_I1016 [Corymbia citriodora subsp. variegata]